MKNKVNDLRTRIKVCGITRSQDALDAIAAGADALGFVFYDKSPRFISPADAAEIIKKLPPFVATVGLFVNADQTYIDEVVTLCGLDVVQLHGDETSFFCDKQRVKVIKALAVSSFEDLVRVTEYNCSVLLDAKAPEGVYGGAGQVFDWSILHGFEHAYPLIIAGGLNVQNINTALALRQWFAVDVSSGVEQFRGIKDREKINSFCKKVHQFNGGV